MQGCGSVSVVLPSSLLRPGTLPDEERKIHLTQLFKIVGQPLYVLGDPELELLGSREKLAQWRHKGRGPAYYKLGRKIVYSGSDLNGWVEKRKVEYSDVGMSAR